MGGDGVRQLRLGETVVLFGFFPGNLFAMATRAQAELLKIIMK
jgi:hypothetical protein